MCFPTCKKPKNAKKAKWDRWTVKQTNRPTDRQTDKVTCRVACTRLNRLTKNKSSIITMRWGSTVAMLVSSNPPIDLSQDVLTNKRKNHFVGS